VPRRAAAESAKRSDDGTSVILVTAIGALAMLISFSMFDWMVVERQSIEDNLTDVRAYWAAKGQLNYALSRTMFVGACSTHCGNNLYDVTTFTTAFLSEINCSNYWTYPELSNYGFVATPVVSPDPNAPNGHMAENLLRVTFASSGTAPTGCVWPSVTPPPALRTIPQVRPVEFRYCVVNDAGTPCGLAPNNATSQHITSVVRPKN
jgi:hypothetical protein